MTAHSDPQGPKSDATSIRRGQATYSFGDVDAAAERLELVDRVFGEPTRALLDVVRSAPIALAVDLGCGPGYSTRLINEWLRPIRLVGLDTSVPFLQRASISALRATWLVHDVTVVPFPTGPADLLHARFVLSHLAQPESVLVSWLGQLNPGGHLLVQDDEEIIASHPALVAYEEMARALVAQRGGDLWAGARLARLDPPDGVRRVHSRVYRHHVPAAVAARMFAMNFAVWRHDPFVVESHPMAALDELGIELNRLADTGHETDVVFDIRQLGYQQA